MTKLRGRGLLIGIFIGGIGVGLLLTAGVRLEAAFFTMMAFAFLLALWNPPLRRFGIRTNRKAEHPADNGE